MSSALRLRTYRLRLHHSNPSLHIRLVYQLPLRRVCLHAESGLVRVSGLTDKQSPADQGGIHLTHGVWRIPFDPGDLHEAGASAVQPRLRRGIQEDGGACARRDGEANARC